MSSGKKCGRVNHFSNFTRLTPGLAYRSMLLATACAGVCGGLSSQAGAASGTWTNTSGGAQNWVLGTNWSTGVAPGATGVTTNNETATFNTSTGEAVTVDSGRNLLNLTFSINPGSFAFSGGNFLLTGNSTVQLDSTVLSTGQTETINTPITMIGNAFFTNNASTNDLLSFGLSSTITGNSAITANTLTLGGTNNGNNLIAGVIANGASPNKVSLTKTGAGVWVLSGQNTYTGTTTINGGTLALDFSQAVSPLTATNIINGTTGNSNLSLGGALTITGGGAGATNSQAFNGVSLTANIASTVGIIQNNATNVNVTLGGISRGAKSTLDLSLPTAGTVSTTSTTASMNGILATAAANGTAYATANGGTTWVANTGGALTALNTYATGNANYTTTKNVDVTNGDSVSGVTVNTLRFNSATDALALAGTNIVNTGGILVTPTATNASMTGGALTGNATGKEIVLLDNGAINIGSAITNNGANAVSLTLGGSGTTTLSGVNTYTGTTLQNGSGMVNLTGSLTGSAITLASGTFSESSTGTINGAVPLTISGGAATLAGVNTFTGGVILSNGTLGIGNSSALGTGTLTLSSGAVNQYPTIFAAGGAQAIGNAVKLSIINPDIIGGSNALTFNGLVSNTSTGSPTLTFSNSALTTLAGGLVLGSDASSRTLSIRGPGDVAITSNINYTTGSASAGSIAYFGNGITTLSGTNNLGAGGFTNIAAPGGKLVVSGVTNTGAVTTSLDEGSLVLDLSTNTAGVLPSFYSFNVGAGNLVVKGGANTAPNSYAQTLGAVQAFGGGGLIVGQGTTLTVQALFPFGDTRVSSATVDLTATNSALVAAPPLTNGVASWLVVKDSTGIGFATTSGSNVVRYTGATVLPTSGQDANTNYSVSGNVALTNTSDSTINSLSIDTSGGAGTLDLNGTTLGIIGSADGGIPITSALLMTGSNNYTIQNGQIGADGKRQLIEQFGTGVLTISGRLGSGASDNQNFGSVVKSGPGTLVLSGTNTYTTGTVIQEGALQAIDGVGLPTASLLELTGGTFQSHGTFGRTLGTGLTWAAGGFAAQGGEYDIKVNGNTGPLTWGTTLNFLNASRSMVLGSVSADSLLDLQNGIDLGNAQGQSRVITVVDNANSTTDIARISGVVSDGAGTTAGILLNGTGTLELSNANNSYLGSTIIRSGALLVSGNAPAGTKGALGLSTSSVLLGDSDSSVTSNAALLTGGAYTVGRDITVAGANASGTSTLGGNTDDNSVFSGNIALNRTVNLQSVTTGSNAVTFSGALSGTGGVVKTGTGSVILSGANNTYAGGTVVNAGMLVAAQQNSFSSGSLTTNNAGVAVLNSMSANPSIRTFGAVTLNDTSMVQLAPSALTGVNRGRDNLVQAASLTFGSANSSLDLADNGMIVQNGSIANIRSKIISGRASGAWTGPGITSSYAAANSTTRAIGYKPGGAAFMGQTTTAATDVLMRTVRLGDANLDGVVNVTDRNIYTANAGAAGAFASGSEQWYTGDFDYNGTVNVADRSKYSANAGLATDSPGQANLGTRTAMAFDAPSGNGIPNVVYNPTSGALTMNADGFGLQVFYVQLDLSKIQSVVADPDGSNGAVWDTYYDGLNQNWEAPFGTATLTAGTWQIAMLTPGLTAAAFGGSEGVYYGDPSGADGFTSVTIGVPEPATLGLIGIGGMLAMRRRRRSV